MLLLLAAPAAGAEAVAAPDLGERVTRALKPLGEAGPDDPAVWASARALAAMGGEALPALRGAAASEQPVGAKLALGWALLSLQDFGPGVEVLTSVVRGEADRASKARAVRLLGRLARDAAEVELSALLDEMEDARVRVALAHALTLAATTEGAEAKATTALVRLARAEEGEARAAAALALAELGDFRDPVPEALAGLAEEPTARGRLATKLLELRRLSDLMIREKEYAGSLGNPLLDEVKDKIREYHLEPPPPEEALVDAAAHGMAALLHKSDPFSAYMSPRVWNDFRTAISGRYGGIGAHVSFLKDDRTGEEVFTAIKPIYSGPGYKAGLRAYDQFLEVDGEAIRGKSSEEIVDLLRGLPESVVVCEVRRRGHEQDEELILKITRKEVTLPSVFHEMLPGGIGYLRLTNFGETSARELDEALHAMEKQHMKVLVFDLRGNPGGLMVAARDIADRFLKDDKLIVYSEGRNRKVAPRKEMRTTDPATHPDFPVLVLVNGGTASAAEIVSGALQDHQRAKLIGERTYGKGSVQQVMPLDATGRRAVLKLTVAKYFLPSGRCIHRTAEDRGGILPDIDCPFEATWTREQFEKHRAAGDFYRYSLVHWPKHKDALMELARFDDEETSRYPGFDAWYDGLKVKTDRDSARRLLRRWLRVLTADELGRDWTSDLQEDNQLQRAVVEAAATIPGLDGSAVPEYRRFFDKPAEGGASPDAD